MLTEPGAGVPAAERPAVRLNQVGFLPGSPIRATVLCSATEPLEVVLTDGEGRAVGSGTSRSWPVRPDPTSGDDVHVVELPAPLVTGTGLRLRVGEHLSHHFPVADGLYAPLARDALRVFRLLRSGAAVPEHVFPGYSRPAGHAGRPPNRGDTAVPAWTGPDAERLYPGWRCPGTFDVSGGWYDAGDYGKYVTSGSIAVWQLLGTLDLLDPATDSWSRSLAETVRSECRWQLDWLLRMQVPAGAPLAGMAFHRVHGTVWSPLPGWAHEDPTLRVLHRPSTPATLQLAAAAAAGARYFAASDPAYGRRLLGAAARAWRAAAEHPDLPAPDDHARFGGGPYGDADAGDDRYWAAAELWLATGDPAYRADLAGSPWHRDDPFPLDGFDYDRVAAPARLDLAASGGALRDHDRVLSSVVAGADRLVDLQTAQPWGQPYAPPAGWAWGSNGRLLNNLVVLAAAARLTGSARFGAAVRTGVDYLLGRNALGQSFVTGYGRDDSRRQRTRQFGHAVDPAFPPPPPGALAGGPNSQPSPDFPYDPRLVGRPPQRCYLDDPTSEVTNDICIRWNAPLVFVATYLHRLAASGSSR